MTTPTQKPRVRLVSKKADPIGSEVVIEPTPTATKKTKAPPAPKPVKVKPVKEDQHAELRVRAYELAFEHQLHPQLCFDILRLGGSVEQWKEKRDEQRAITVAARIERRKIYRKERKARLRQAFQEKNPLEITWLKSHREIGLPLYFHTVTGVQSAIFHAIESYQYMTRLSADTPPREAQNHEKLECLSISAKPSNSIYQGVDAKLRAKNLRPPKTIGLRIPFPQAKLELAMASDAEVKITLYDGSICKGRIRWAEEHSFLLHRQEDELFVFKHGVLGLQLE